MSKSSQNIAVDIGTSQLKIAVFYESKGSVVIKRLITEDTVYIERKNLHEKIKEVLERNFKRQELSGAKVSLILSYPFIEIKRLELPKMPQEEIEQAIRWQAKDKIASDIEKSYFDYTVSDEVLGEHDSKKLIVMAAISPREIIDKFAELSNALSIEIEGIYASPHILANILRAFSEIKKTETVSVVEIGYDHAYISLYKNSKLVFIRVIPVASRQITSAVSGVFTTEPGDKIEVTPDRAEMLKIKYGIPMDIKEEAIEGGIPVKQILARMRPVLENLYGEIKRSFDYYTAELEGERPKKIYLAGAGSQLKNLNIFLSESLNTDIEYIRLPNEIKNEGGQNIIPFIPAVSPSLSVSSEERPNLLPIEFRKQKLRYFEKISIRMVSVAAFVVLAASYMFLSLRMYEYKNRLASIQSHRYVMQSLVEMYDKVSERTALINKITAGTFSYVDIMKKMSMIVPDNTMFERISISSERKIVNILGKLYFATDKSEDVLTKLMQEIEGSRLFSDVNLKKVEKSQIDKEEISTFEIDCIIK